MILIHITLIIIFNKDKIKLIIQLSSIIFTDLILLVFIE